MNFIVSDRESVERGVRVRTAYLVVSIRDPGRPRAKVPRQSGLRDVLYLAFHDAEPVPGVPLPEEVRLMTEAQARGIWQFVRKHEAEVGAVLVHCEQGMSRSPGVAAALCRGCGGDESRFFREYQPNDYVYRMMLRSAGLGGPGGSAAGSR